MNSIFRILVSSVVLLIAVTGCTGQTEPPPVIALLAPFEGRYQEFGYDALYAARLALSDQESDMDLIAYDDGGSLEYAVERARAIASDPSTAIVLVTGPFTTQEQVQIALSPLPIVVIGGWSTPPYRDDVSILSNADILGQLSDNSNESVEFIANVTDEPIVGGERLASSLIAYGADDSLTLVTSAQLPSADFVERYISSAEFAPEPGLLAALAYDATGLAIETIRSGNDLSDIVFDGLSGPIQFENGYWAQAPIFSYRYENGRLTQQTD